MNIIRQLKQYGWVVVVLVVVLIIALIFALQPKLEAPKEENIPSAPSTALELEYLSSTELESLGVTPSIKAQIIHRNPLVYKIINDETDIVKDIREIGDYRQ